MSNVNTEAMLVIIDCLKSDENLMMRLEFADFPKGQLISKGLVGILNSSKKPTKNTTYSTMIPPVDLFSFNFWKKLKTPKNISKLMDL